MQGIKFDIKMGIYKNPSVKAEVSNAHIGTTIYFACQMAKQFHI